MNQPHSLRAAGTSVPPADPAIEPAPAPEPAPTPAAATATVGERHVLMRIPDCSTFGQEAGRGAGLFSAAAWRALLASGLEDLVRPWRRPRTLLAGAVGVALVIAVVILMTASRHRGTTHADSERRLENIDAPASTGPNAGLVAGARAPQANTPGGVELDEAPRFPGNEVNQPRPNAAGAIDARTGAPQRATSSAPGQSLRPRVEQAHLRKHIESAPIQH